MVARTPRRVLVTLSVLLGVTFTGCGGPDSSRGSSVPTADVSGSAAPSASPTTHATAFTLDTTFANGGVAEIATPIGVALCQSTLGAIAVTSDAIYLAGTFPMPDDEVLGGCDAGVLKVLHTGKIDTSFGTNGIARVDRAYGFLNAIAVGADGKITVAGAFLTENDKLEPDLSVDLHFAPVGPVLGAQRIAETAVLAGRLLPSGAPDKTFNGSGAVRFSGHPGMLSNDILTGADGSLLIVGSTKTPSISDEGQIVLTKAEGFALKLGANGQVDKKFGEKGAAYFDPGPGKLVGGYVSKTGDGKLVFVGEHGNQSFLARVTPDLVLDPTYGEKGFVDTLRAQAEDDAIAHLDARDGAVLATAKQGGALTLGRWDAAGKPMTWGRGGRVTLSNEPTEAADLEVLRRDGTLYHFVQRPGEPILVTRIDAAGNVDPTTSAARLDDPGTFVMAFVTEGPSGTILVVSMNEDMQLRIARYGAT